MSHSLAPWFLGLTIAVGCATVGAIHRQVRPATGAGTPSVHVDTGTLEGRVDPDSSVLVFRGIPYATPPVGELRWRPPAPAPSWTGTRSAVDYGASCPRPGPRGSSGLEEPTSEDCLFLNVYTPALRDGRTAGRPVMVWLHGGGFVGGSARHYDGHTLAGKGAVVVTLNYRLGALGYLAHPALATSPQHSAGNYGLLDQIAALEWVRRNIRQFGGDPGRVTIFGESAGGFSVGALLASPLARGLFHRAISQSGTGLGFGILSADSARAFAEEGAARIGIRGDDAGKAAALRAVSVEKLLEAYGGTYAPLRPFTTWFGPVIDGAILPHSLDRAISGGTWNAVPVIVGSNAAEGWYFGPRACRTHDLLAPAAPCFSTDPSRGRETLNTYSSLLSSGYGDRTGELARAYPASTPERAQEQAHQLVGDMGFGAPARALARLIAAGNGTAYLYHFTRESSDAAGRRIRALHTTEVPFAFGRLPGVWEPYSAYRGHASYDRRLADAMSDFWVSFATSGDPNRRPAAGRSLWRRHTLNDGGYLALGAAIESRRGLRERQYRVLDRLARADGEIRR